VAHNDHHHLQLAKLKRAKQWLSEVIEDVKARPLTGQTRAASRIITLDTNTGKMTLEITNLFNELEKEQPK
jgi:hypothetical protein